MRKNKIIIIDDNIEICDMIEIALENEDIVVDKFDRPKKFLEKLKEYNEENLDLIILDIMMPEIDGLELLSILDKNLETKNIPKIVLSSYNSLENMKESYDNNALLFLSKPINITEFIFQVKTMIRLKKSEDYYRNIIKLLKEHNKKLFNEILATKPNNINKSFCLLFNDLNEMPKIISDSYHIANTLYKMSSNDIVIDSNKKIIEELKNNLEKLYNKTGELEKVYNLLAKLCDFSLDK